MIGRQDLRSNQGQVRRVTKIFRMPRYGGRLDSDLMLLQLDSPSTLRTLPLADSSVRNEWNAGHDIRTYGYGRTGRSQDGSRYQLNAVFRINTFSPKPPGGGAYRANEKFVATWTGRQACKGDSGGPTVKRTSKGERLVGINSDVYGSTQDCNGKNGNVYFKVGHKGNVANSPGYFWVTRCLQNRSTCGTYPK